MKRSKSYRLCSLNLVFIGINCLNKKAWLRAGPVLILDNKNNAMYGAFWVKLDKKVLSLNSDLYVCLCYVTPDDSSRQSLVETNIFDGLPESVVYVENKTQNDCNILYVEIFNGRSSDNPDFVIDDDPTHISVLPDDYIPDGFMQRISEDQGHVKIAKRLGVRAVVVDSSNIFSDTAGYSKSRFELYFWKNASNKIIFQIFALLIIGAGLYN